VEGSRGKVGWLWSFLQRCVYGPSPTFSACPEEQRIALDISVIFMSLHWCPESTEIQHFGASACCYRIEECFPSLNSWFEIQSYFSSLLLCIKNLSLQDGGYSYSFVQTMLRFGKEMSFVTGLQKPWETSAFFWNMGWISRASSPDDSVRVL